MADIDPAERETTVDDLNQFDVGRRVTFRRADGNPGRPIVVGKLLAVNETTYMRGNMPKRGYVLRVEYARAPYASVNIDDHGPVPASFPVTVGPKWHDRVDKYDFD